MFTSSMAHVVFGLGKMDPFFYLYTDSTSLGDKENICPRTNGKFGAIYCSLRAGGNKQVCFYLCLSSAHTQREIKY